MYARLNNMINKKLGEFVECEDCSEDFWVLRQHLGRRKKCPLCQLKKNNDYATRVQRERRARNRQLK